MLCPMRPSVSILWPYYKKRKKRPYIIVAVHAEGLDLLHDRPSSWPSFWPSLFAPLAVGATCSARWPIVSKNSGDDAVSDLISWGDMFEKYSNARLVLGYASRLEALMVGPRCAVPGLDRVPQLFSEGQVRRGSSSSSRAP